MSYIQDAFNQAQATLNQFIANPKNLSSVERATTMLVDCFKKGGKVMSCGNGGSMCDAIHFAEELTGRFRKDRPALPAMAISDPGHISCVANDYGYEHVFAKMVEAFGQPHDVLLAISTSGNSKNVIKAVEIAKYKGMKVIGLLGKDGGQLRNLVDEAIIVQSEVTDRVQEIHIKIIHTFIEGIERAIFPKNYT